MTAIGGIPFSSHKSEIVDTKKPWMRAAMQPGLGEAELEALVKERFALSRDAKARWNLAMVMPAGDGRSRLRELMQWLRDDERLRFNVLLDINAVDYLSFPNHRGPRFAIHYLLKSLLFRHRITIKVEVEEEDAELPSMSHLWRIADWAEREAWDQMGVRFVGHPDLRRLLNHHEFVGHPLRKDYPVQKRQKLSINDAMVDQLEARLRSQGYTVLESGEVFLGDAISKQAQLPGETGNTSANQDAAAVAALGDAAAAPSPAGAGKAP